MTDPDARSLGDQEFLTVRFGGDTNSPERLMLVGRPREDGTVRVREWTSNSWNSEGDDYEMDVEELRGGIEQAYEAHRLVGEEIYRVRRWLEGA